MKKRRFVEAVDDRFNQDSKEVVGLSLLNTTGEMMSPPVDLVSKFLTTRFGMSYESTSKSLFQQQPLYGDLSAPYTLVSTIYFLLIEVAKE